MTYILLYDCDGESDGEASGNERERHNRWVIVENLGHGGTTVAGAHVSTASTLYLMVGVNYSMRGSPA